MSQRRRGGFRGPELRGTLGTLLRSTLQQAGVVRDALTRGAQEGRSRLDEMRHDRRRHDALAELGETVLELIRNGEIDVAELPEVRGIVRELDDLDGDAHHDAVEQLPRDIATPPTRSRFDERAARSPRAGGDGDDGTVSSSRWAPIRAAAARVWRPVAAEPADHDHDDAGEAFAPMAPAADPPRLPRPDLLRKGGISFEDDDLAEYMHPDDVPPKPPNDES